MLIPEYEICCNCGDPTGKAGKGEDSIYWLDELGPLCNECNDKLRKEVLAALPAVKGGG